MRKILFNVVLLLMIGVAAEAGPAMFYNQPDTGLASNVAVDIFIHRNGLWLATGGGLNVTFDNGNTWLLYDSDHGLVSNDISALFGIGNRLWVATNHVGDVGGTAESFSDGLSFSDDLGASWTRIKFDSLTNPVKFVTGPYRTVYDITGFDDHRQNRNWLFFAEFAGGFIASQDGGINWRRIFPSLSDSLNFANAYSDTPTVALSLENRYFSCVADSSHGDSMFIWAGTAGGIFQMVFLLPKDKYYVRPVKAITFGDRLSGGSNFFLGGENGLSRGIAPGKKFESKFASDGLTGDAVSSIISFGENLLAGGYDSATGNSTGLAISTNSGNSFTPVTINPSVTGEDKVIREFASIRSRLYMAAEKAGLYVSEDSGNSWTHQYVDTSDTTAGNNRNIVNSIFAIADTLWVGTDSGYATLTFDSTGLIDSTEFPLMADTLYRVLKVRVQRYGYNSVSGDYDSACIWLANQSLEYSNLRNIARKKIGTNDWRTIQTGEVTNDIGILGDFTFFLQNHGIKFSALGVDPGNTYFVVKHVYDSSIVMSGNDPLVPNDDVFVSYIKGDTVVFGGSRGYAISVNGAKTFRITRPVIDTLKPDVSVRYTYLNSINVDGTTVTEGMTGDFIPSLGIQYVPDEPARIWASCRPATYGGHFGISAARNILDSTIVIDYDSDGDSIGYHYEAIHKYRWDVVHPDLFAWNFEMVGTDTVFAATDDGLIRITGDAPTDYVVDTISFKNSQGQDLLFPNTAIYSVGAMDSFLWVGTDDGTLRLRLDSLSKNRLFIVADSSEEVYAFPTPFSPQRDDFVRFHFVCKEAGNITVEIYDFAMNLVSRPIDNQYFPASIIPPGQLGEEQRPYWDGKNGKGDIVAVGVYYFKVIFSTGEVKWGKLAVMP